MYSTPISLRFAPSERRVLVRELTGYDERRVSGTSTRDALDLIEAVLVSIQGDGTSPHAEDFVAADRDRILAELYVRTFGDRIESTLRCEDCGIQFDIDFSLQELTATVEQRPPNRDYASVEPNLFEAVGGWRFRLPTGREECAVAGFDRGAAETALFEMCVAETESRPDIADLQTALDEVAPLLELELTASCPECERIHLVQFDIQTYLLRSLLNEQGRRIHEIHRLAAAYGWSLDEILSLTRTERRKLVELVEDEISRRRTER
jgi:hypothetical protein